MNVAAIDAIVQGQAERNVKEYTNGIYMSKCSVMISMINKIPPMQVQALELEADGNTLMHSGKAKAIHKLKLPIDVATAKRCLRLYLLMRNSLRKREEQRGLLTKSLPPRTILKSLQKDN